MAVTEHTQEISLTAAADYSAKQYFLVTAAAGVATLAGDGANAVGILQNDPAAVGRAAVVAIGGRTKASAAAAIAAGSRFASDANGQLVIAASNDYVLGVVDEAATAADDIISVIFDKNGIEP